MLNYSVYSSGNTPVSSANSESTVQAFTFCGWLVNAASISLDRFSETDYRKNEACANREVITN